ncbi:MAG: FAD-dependent oxidoreductase [Sphingobium sp.]
MSELLVIGGGLSGGAAALLLARMGKSVRLIERTAAPKDKICGEFLSIAAQDHLRALGIDLDAMGAVRVDRIRVVGGRSVETPLPFTARGISRKRLDEALLKLAEASGATVERGVRASEIRAREVTTSDGDRHADAILLATGKLDVRTTQRAGDMPRDAHVGFKMHWRVDAPAAALLDGVIELVLFPGGYAGLQMVESGVANLCLVVRRGRLRAFGGQWQDVLASLAGRSRALDAVIGSQPLFARPLTIANLAYGRLPRDTTGEDSYRLGDQAAMTASLTGDGMAIALRSAWLAARCLQAGEPAARYHERIGAMVTQQVRRGMILQHMADMPLLRQVGLGLLSWRPALLRSITQLTRLPAVAME